MKFAVIAVIFIAANLLFYQIRVWPFREKKTREPERTAHAEVIARRVKSGTGRSGRSSGMGYSHLLAFRMDDGQELELYAYDTEFGALREGMRGQLTWKGPYFIDFAQEVAP